MGYQCISVEELKSLQLDMLVEIDKYCNENGLEYSLAYGTLLGAVRHHGYIPWDDDIDIMMLRGDYEKFIADFSASNLEVCYHPKSVDYFLPFAKVIRTDTVMEEDVSIKSNLGVYIDVFPIDTLPENKYKRKLVVMVKRFLNLLYNFKVVRLSSHRGIVRNVVLGIGKFLCLLLPMRLLLVCMSKISRCAEGKASTVCGAIADMDKNSSEVYPKEFFSSFSTLEFEGKQFKSISSYDAWLRHMYGDYMQLPPFEQRVSHHTFKAYWK